MANRNFTHETHKLMRILILEDEIRAAKQLQKMLFRLLGSENLSIQVHTELDEAQAYLGQNPIDLLILDLNLNGEDGFEFLKAFSAESFETIICSAYKEKAFQAFEYGVLDFLSKPLEVDRLEKALARLNRETSAKQAAKYLVIKKSLNNLILPLEDVSFLEAQEHHTLVGLKDQRKELHHKSLSKLQKLLPDNFERIHRSFVVNKDHMSEIKLFEGSKQVLILSNGVNVPIGRKYYAAFKKYFA